MAALGLCVWWHWGQGAELAQPLIITDSKQLELFRPIFPPSSDGQRVHFGMRRDGRGDEKERREERWTKTVILIFGGDDGGSVRGAGDLETGL